MNKARKKLSLPETEFRKNRFIQDQSINSKNFMSNIKLSYTFDKEQHQCGIQEFLTDMYA